MRDSVEHIAQSSYEIYTGDSGHLSLNLFGPRAPGLDFFQPWLWTDGNVLILNSTNINTWQWFSQI